MIENEAHAGMQKWGVGVDVLLLRIAFTIAGFDRDWYAKVGGYGWRSFLERVADWYAKVEGLV